MMTTQERYRGIIGWFQQHMPIAESELHFDNPYQLLVAVILSAQCTDKRVNMTTPALFDRFPTPQQMAEVDPEEIYPYIKSISYPNNKAKNLSAMARMLCSELGSSNNLDVRLIEAMLYYPRKCPIRLNCLPFARANIKWINTRIRWETLRSDYETCSRRAKTVA